MDKTDTEGTSDQLKGRRLLVGDLHGNLFGLQQALDECDFNYGVDELYSIGDLCDGWYMTPEVIDLLMQIPNFTLVLGNHEKYLMEYLFSANIHPDWRANGGQATIDAYSMIPSDMREKHRRFLNTGHYYYILDEYLLVHGGYDWRIPLAENVWSHGNNNIFTWDRELWEKVWKIETSPKYEIKFLPTKDDFKKIFIGHTAIGHLNNYEPIQACQVWNIDTGGGSEGKVTIIDMDTEEWWQSEMAVDIYEQSERAHIFKQHMKKYNDK